MDFMLHLRHHRCDMDRSKRLFLPAAFFPTPGLSPDQRPAHWARAIRPEVAGLPNLFQVSEGLYRSAQPSAQGFRAARQMGITSVLSLRQTLRDEPLAQGSGLDLARVPMKTRHVAEKGGAKVVTSLRALQDGLARGAVLVHCHHGADRTGLIVALYRLLWQGWTREESIAELRLGGFGYHAIWGNIPRYIARVDLDELRQRIFE